MSIEQFAKSIHSPPAAAGRRTALSTIGFKRANPLLRSPDDMAAWSTGASTAALRY
jgi:hypothetical protein